MKSAKHALQQLQSASHDLANLSGELKSRSSMRITKRDRENMTDAITAHLLALKDVIDIGKHVNGNHILKQLGLAPKPYVKPKPMGND